MGDAATPVLPDFTSQLAATYKANIDAGFAVADRVAWAFAPHEQGTPDLTVRLEAGAIFDGTTLTEVAAQNTSAVVAPSVNPRIDRVVIDRSTGVVSVITGAEAPSPSPPAITAGDVPVAQIALIVSQTSILNIDITDERDLGLMGLGFLAIDDIDGLTEETTIDGAADFVPLFDASAGTIRKAKPDNLAASFASGTKMLFQQTAAPTGWTKDTTHNDKALRVVTGTVGSAGATAFTTVFGASKTTGNASPGFSSHSHTPRGMRNNGNTNTDVVRIWPPTAATDGTLRNANDTTTSSGSGSSHSHTLPLDLQYVDLIIATKD